MSILSEETKERVVHFLEQLPTVEREKALHNMRKYPHMEGVLANAVGVESISDAINWGFRWHSTPEGGPYWSRLFDKYRTMSDSEIPYGVKTEESLLATPVTEDLL